MQFIPVKTRAMMPPKDNIYPVLDRYLPHLKDGDILFVTSKILAVHQGRCVKIKTGDLKERRALAKKESDYYFYSSKDDNFLAVAGNILSRSAGIDKSNGGGYYILRPKNLNKFLKEIAFYLKKKNKIKKLAVIAIDSSTIPLRWGVVGSAIGCFGLKPLKSAEGKPDIFGRPLKGTKINILDSISAFANIFMGESGEQTPIAIGRGLDFIEFNDKSAFKELLVGVEEDYYKPLFKNFKKI